MSMLQVSPTAEDHIDADVFENADQGGKGVEQPMLVATVADQ